MSDHLTNPNGQAGCANRRKSRLSGGTCNRIWVLVMSKILVCGGVDDADHGKVRGRFAAALGRNVILRGHVLLGGCRTSFDEQVAAAAVKAAIEKKLDQKRVVLSWVNRGEKPFHCYGQFMQSQLNNWSEIPRGLVFPEPIQKADAIIIVGGWDGTQRAASWARLAGKPLLPVATFGDAAADIFKDELATYDRRYGAMIPIDEYQILNRYLVDETDVSVDEYAVEVLKLAERAILSSEVFIVMPFEDKGHLVDAYTGSISD